MNGTEQAQPGDTSSATPAPFAGIEAMQLTAEGTMTVLLVDGRVVSEPLGQPAFAPTSAIAASTFLPQTFELHLRTTHGDHILIDLPLPWDLAPTRGRPVIYLDQKDWSTLTNTIYHRERVPDGDELAAAEAVIELVDRQIILAMSSAHMSETCKQADVDERYRRVVMIAQLSAGWQLRDPIHLRRIELTQHLTSRYTTYCPLPPAAVTLEPDAIHAGRPSGIADVATDLPEPFRWAIHAIRCIGGNLDVMLDEEPVPDHPQHGWVQRFQRFAAFLSEDPTGPELRRARTHAMFIADLGPELAEASHAAGIRPEDMSDWTLRHSEADLLAAPALGLFREVIHEKLCDHQLRWEPNDLVDMMFLTAAAGYCEHVVGERRHISYLASALRRLDRDVNVHRNLRSLTAVL